MMNSKSFPRLIFTALLLSVMITACDKVKKSREPKMAHADSVIFDVGTAKDYERMRALSDSFELTKDISSLDANRWRGVSYYRQGQYRLAEIYYRKASGERHQVGTRLGELY